jgi:acyl-CoA dehydrogenase
VDREPAPEQRAVVQTTEAFVHRELVLHEDEVERSGGPDPTLADRLRVRAIGGWTVRREHARGGRRRLVDKLSWMPMERQLGPAAEWCGAILMDAGYQTAPSRP